MGNLVEYALLIGFALFIFFILVSVVLSALDWTIGQSDNFTNTAGGWGKIIGFKFLLNKIK